MLTALLETNLLLFMSTQILESFGGSDFDFLFADERTDIRSQTCKYLINFSSFLVVFLKHLKVGYITLIPFRLFLELTLHFRLR